MLPNFTLLPITQLLEYLTWQDSKSTTLDTAKEAIKEYPIYLGFVSEKEDGWYHYRFHINNDESREVKLSVMLFYIPK